MARIDSSLLGELKASPEAKVNLILRTKGEPDDLIPLIQSRGIQVRRRFRLLKAVAIEGKAAACLKLVDEPWVEAIEEDREVRIMG